MAKKQLFLAFRFFLAFDDKAGDNFVGRSGTNNFETYEIATTDFTDYTDEGDKKRKSGEQISRVQVIGKAEYQIKE